MADLTPIPMGISWDPWDPSLPHSHAHLYGKAVRLALRHRVLIASRRLQLRYRRQQTPPRYPLARRTRPVFSSADVWDTTRPQRRNGGVSLRTTTQ